MGAATKHKQAFLAQHRRCAFCGGSKPATTVEHCPPRAMFQDRQWPTDFEFPCCEPCNGGTSNDDLLVAMLARMDPFTDGGDADGKTNGLISAVSRQFPDLFEKTLLTAREARTTNQKLGLKRKPGQTHQETGVLKVPPEFHISVCTFGRKLAKAVFYLHTSRIFPQDGCLMLHWFSNELLVTKGIYPQFEDLKTLAGYAPTLTRSGRFLNNQFSYKFSLDVPKNMFALQAVFGRSFGFVIFGSDAAGQLEAKIRTLRETTGSDGPFAIIQSGSIAIEDDFGFATSKRTTVRKTD